MRKFSDPASEKAHVRAPGRAAGPRGADGRLGLDPDTAICRDDEHLGDLPRGPRGLVGVGKRGHPWLRGGNGVMTFIGGIGHTLPYSLSNFRAATALAVAAGAG